MSLVKNARNRHKDQPDGPQTRAPAPAAPSHGNAAAQEAVHRDRVEMGELQSVESGDGGLHVNLLEMEGGDGNTAVTGPHARLSAGQVNRREHEGDARRYGIRMDAGLASVQGGNERHGGELDTPSAAAEATIGDDGATLGVGGNVLSGAGRTTISTGGQTDLRLRGGLGAGAGAGVRWHWGDSDGDGLREIGTGGDVGPFTGDVTTELLHQWWNEL